MIADVNVIILHGIASLSGSRPAERESKGKAAEDTVLDHTHLSGEFGGKRASSKAASFFYQFLDISLEIHTCCLAPGRILTAAHMCNWCQIL